MIKKKRVLITGISGFVGSHLAKYLLDSGNDIYGLVRRRADGSRPRNLVDRNIYEEVHLIEGDITNISSISFVLEKARPDIIFHLAAQSFVPRSFVNPIETLQTNTLGTAYLLESVRIKDLDAVTIHSGSSEEYGLTFFSREQYDKALKRYGVIFPPPVGIPELPISEDNFLRPMSPYAVSKLHGEYLMRNYHSSYGLKTIVSRGFNTEGPGRGIMFVTSAIACQVMKLKFGESDKIVAGNVNAFRDWSHIADIVKGYCLLAEKGKSGEVYNQGSMRTNSILTYILLSLEKVGWKVERIESMNGDRVVENPVERNNDRMFGLEFEKTRIDELMLAGELEFEIQDRGIWVYTDKGKILIEFDADRFRSAEVPILLSSCQKIGQLGFKLEHKLDDIITDQLDFYLQKDRRSL